MLSYEEYVSLQVKLQLDKKELTKDEFSKLMKHNYEVQKAQVETVKRLELTNKYLESGNANTNAIMSYEEMIYNVSDQGFANLQQSYTNSTVQPSTVELVKGKPIETDKAILFVLLAGFALMGCVWVSKALLGWGLGDY